MIKERACDDAIDALDAARSIRSFPQAIQIYTYFNGEPLLVVDAEPRCDARGALRERERGRRLVVCVLCRRSRRDDHGARAAPERVLQQPRQHRISIRNVAAAPVGLRRQVRERRDTITQSAQRRVDRPELARELLGRGDLVGPM